MEFFFTAYNLRSQDRFDENVISENKTFSKALQSVHIYVNLSLLMISDTLALIGQTSFQRFANCHYANNQCHYQLSNFA